MKIEDAVNSKIPSAQIKAAINVRYTANYLSALQNSFMAKYHITMPQFNILRIFYMFNSILLILFFNVTSGFELFLMFVLL